MQDDIHLGEMVIDEGVKPAVGVGENADAHGGGLGRSCFGCQRVGW
jgi:hypothetical protein